MLIHKRKQPAPLHDPSVGLRKAGQHSSRQRRSTLCLSQRQAGCQSAGCLGFGGMHLIRKTHRRFIYLLSASCRNAEMSCKCSIRTGAKFFLTFVSLTLCCARKILYLFYSLILKEVRKSFLKKHRYAFIFKSCKSSKFLLVGTSSFSRSKCCLFLLLF